VGKPWEDKCEEDLNSVVIARNKHHGQRQERGDDGPDVRDPGSEGRHHKQQRRLAKEETKSHVIGSRYRADQWASFKATRNPPYS
jgi:hypothetical protein